MKNYIKFLIVGIFIPTLFLLMFAMGCSEEDPVPSFSCNDIVDNSRFSSEEPFSSEIDVIEHSSLRLEANNGTIEIMEVSNSNSIKVTGKKRVESTSKEDADAHLKELSVDIQDLTKEILIKTVQPKYSGGRNYIINYTITIPKDLNITVSSVNGCVKLDEIIGNVAVDLINGDIDSRVTLPLDGTIDLSVVNGNIYLNVPMNTSAIFTSKVANGNIRVSNLELRNRIETANSLTGMVGDGRGTIRLNIGNGRIRATGF